ncbi:MAG: hypothetical protein EOP58_00110 [Sphingomonadales bacterium]|nr:MAG: hypothetical protein EOP58_00110 [Sphingomonadales bacterium]
MSELFLGLLLLLGQTATGDTYKELDADALMAAAPFGVDITPDETAWINMAPVGQTSDYAVRARDYLNIKSSYPTVWIRGYHRRNPRVDYRESKLRVTFDCKGERYSEDYVVHYKANGAFSEYGGRAGGYHPVVPGTEAANWLRFVCKNFANPG